MPVALIRPAATGNYSACDVGAGSRPTCVDPGDPVSHDDATSYLRSNGDSLDSYTTQGHPTSIGTVVSWTQKARCGQGSGLPVDMALFLRAGGVDGTQSTFSFVGTPIAYTDFSAAVARPGGGTFVPADFVATLELGIRLQSGSGFALCTSLWGELTYTSPAGGLLFLILSLGPLVAVQLSEMPWIAAAVQLKTGKLILPAEYEAAWLELREYRHPRHFDYRGCTMGA